MTYPLNDSDPLSATSGFITIVSGLPRSGTSMMMRMLAAGGLPVLADSVRTPDLDNPRGYFELEQVKKLKEDKSWLPEAAGKVVKIVSFLLPEVPAEFPCKVIFLRRALPEVLASQRQMLIRRGETPDAAEDERLTALYGKHLQHLSAWLARQPNMDVLYVDHRRALESPQGVAEEVNAFLGAGLDTAAMAAAVEPRLHRHRFELETP